MKKLIIIKYAELSTKKGNIGFFLNILKKNVELALSGEKVLIKYDKGRMFVIPDEDNFDVVVDKIQKVFGIYEIVIGYEFLDTSFKNISDELRKLIGGKDFQTFKIETKRSDKNYEITSIEMNKKLGEVVLESKKDIKVDVHNPEVIIYVEIRKSGAYIYFEKIAGIGGYPVGSLGKGLLMLSGGIDSPVAGYLTIKRGVKLEAVYFESPPHTSDQALNKVLELSKRLALYNNDLKIHIVNFTEIQEAIYKNIPHEYLITIMRRMMYRISAIIAKRNRCHILVNGESIGQVASQTLTSMSVINRVVNIPVIRPVACFDKSEIIQLARNISTYETSILPYEDCCTIFVPEHPVINPDLGLCEEYEKKISFDDLIYQAVKTHKVIKIRANQKEFEDIL